MKVVMVRSGFAPEPDYLAMLSTQVDLVVYGRMTRIRRDVLPPHAPPEIVPSRVLRPVVVTPRGPLVWFYPALHRALEEDNPDVVYVIGEPWRVVALQAAAWARAHPRSAFVVHAADINWWSVPAHERVIRRLAARRALARADAYVGNSRASVDEAERFGLPADAITSVIHIHPRDEGCFRPPANTGEQAAVRRALGLPLEGRGIGFLGRLSEEKGPLLFLDAVAQLDETEDDWFVLAGTGALEGEVRRRVRPPRVTHLDWLDYPQQVAEFLRAVDVLVVPSVRIGRFEEQGPRAVIEAMFSGCAIVATNVGALPDMVGAAGIVVEPDAAALAAGIRRADRKHGLAARAAAIELYSSGAIAEQIVDVWRAALERRRPGTPILVAKNS